MATISTLFSLAVCIAAWRGYRWMGITLVSKEAGSIMLVLSLIISSFLLVKRYL